FKQLFQNAPLPYQLLDLDGNILAVNAKWLKAFGYKVSEVAGKPFKNIITKKYHPVFEKNFQDLITQGEIFNVEFEFLTKNNKVFIGSLDAGIDYNGKAVPTQAYCMINDITEKKRQQDKILKLNRLYSFLSETNKVLVRVSNKEELFNKITDIAYDIGKFKLAWAGFINWENNEVIPVSLRGNDKEIFNKIKIKIDDSPNASGISGRAVRNNRPVWSNNILSDPEMIFFYETALNNAYNSCIAFPLYVDTNVIGLFSLYAAEVNFFDSEEISLLKEIASNISYALSVFKNNEDKAEYEELLKYQAQLLLNVSDAIISTDNDLNIKSWNKAAEHLYGFTSSEVVGRKAGEILNLKLREVAFSQIAQIIRSEGSWKRELSSVNKKGKNLEISISFSNMVDGNNNSTGFVAIMRDVSERKTAESKLRTLSTAVAQSSLAVIITDVSGRIEYVNKRFLQITGYSLSEAIGQKPSIIKSGLNKEEIYKELWETITGGKDWKGEFLNKKKNGEYFWETASISPIKDGEGRIVNFVGIKEDITEKKHIIQELIQAKEKAEESNKVKTYFLSNMSHELRTPMMGILGFADILKNEITNPNLKEMVKNISYSGNRLLETLNLILNLSRIEANKIEIDYSAINLAEFVEGHTKLFEGAAFIKRIYLNTSIHYPDISILADKRILRDILNNLLTNAIKYTEKGGVVVETDMVIVDGTKKLAVIKVKDTGIGIPEDKTKLIFEEFRQVSEGLNRRFEGTGLGLTITKKLVNLLNGEISVESKIGEGSVFSISFPVNEQAVAASKTDDDVELDKVMPFKAAARGKKSILLVEDDSSSQLIASILLKTLGKVDVVDTGEEAIAKVTTKNYSIILMDINLGIGINGIDAVRKIRKYDNYKYTPIVAITAFAMEGDREEFLSKGFTHYISKPYKNEALFNMVKEILQ
ncbi:MAG: PAS domain S-box protein, partial [Bacteroidota bacterium]|nr:PAS domain S-box protein [Bacteroidota bacterium]